MQFDARPFHRFGCLAGIGFEGLVGGYARFLGGRDICGARGCCAACTAATMAAIVSTATLGAAGGAGASGASCKSASCGSAAGAGGTAASASRPGASSSTSSDCISSTAAAATSAANCSVSWSIRRIARSSLASASAERWRCRGTAGFCGLTAAAAAAAPGWAALRLTGCGRIGSRLCRV